MQLAEAVHRYGKSIGVRVLPVYGGASMDSQLRALEARRRRRRRDARPRARPRQPQVAAPRGPAHARPRRGRRDARHGLRRGPRGDPRRDAVGRARRRSSPRRCRRASSRSPRKHLENPVRIAIARETTAAGKMPKVRQTAYVVARGHKRAALGRVLDLESPTAALVFCRTRLEVDDLTESLKGRGLRVEALHGGISQAERDRVMKKLRAGTLELVVATDVAARGLDIGHLSHVVNYDVPVLARRLRPPDRPHGPRRARGRRDHARRAARALAAEEHRARDEAEDRDRQRPDGRRPAREAPGADARVAARVAARGRLRRLPRRRRVAGGGVRPAGRRRRGREARRSLRRRHRLRERRARDPGGRRAARARRGPGRASARSSRRRAGSRTPRSIFIGAGRADGVRPGDLVGAIAKVAKVHPARRRLDPDRRTLLPRRGPRRRSPKTSSAPSAPAASAATKSP